jgi:hypothetical protein
MSKLKRNYTDAEIDAVNQIGKCSLLLRRKLRSQETRKYASSWFGCRYERRRLQHDRSGLGLRSMENNIDSDLDYAQSVITGTCPSCGCATRSQTDKVHDDNCIRVNKGITLYDVRNVACGYDAETREAYFSADNGCEIKRHLSCPEDFEFLMQVWDSVVNETKDDATTGYTKIEWT